MNLEELMTLISVLNEKTSNLQLPAKFLCRPMLTRKIENVLTPWNVFTA